MIGLVDADGFFAGCELSRHPELRGKPVMVLGKLGSFVLAKTQEAKERGVRTVMPYKEAKRLCPDGIYLEGDFRFYTLISRQLMAILKEWCPVVQVTSIDEAYMDMTGMEEMYGKDFGALGDELRDRVKSSLGITVTIGMSVNKVLAKMASERNKPDGTALIPRKDIPHFLAGAQVGEVPGIGYRREQLVTKYGIIKADELARLPMGAVKSLFGRNGILLWKELRGEYIFKVNPRPRIPKQIGRTSSLEKSTSDVRQIEGLAFYHLERSLEALHRHKLMAREISLHLRDYELRIYRIPLKLEKPTDDFFTLAKALSRLIRRMPRAKLWRSAGVLFYDLCSASVRQLDLFEGIEKTLRDERLNEARDKLNEYYGQFAVTSGSTLFLKKKKNRKDRFNLPLIS